LTLTYRGPLPPKQRGRRESTKKIIREHFHPQIERQVTPRLGNGRALITTRVGDHEFITPAHRGFRTAVELDVLLLTPSRFHAGDIDNRVKTLVDALCPPVSGSADLTSYVPPPAGPMFCLMQDDRLVARLSVDARPWFEPVQGDSETLAIVSATFVLGDNADMTSNIGNLFLVI